MTGTRATVRRRAGAVVALLLVVLALLGPLGRPAAAAPPEVPDGRRVLILSVPGLTWKDLESSALPTLQAFVDDAAIANLATRVTRIVADPGEAYLTLGTGTRAVAPRAFAGLVFDAQEPFGTGVAADEHARQQGSSADADVVALSWALLESANDAAEFGGDIGGLGQVLADAGIDRGLVANADGSDPVVQGAPLHREAALALADSRGTVPCGAVGPGLLESADAAPFGVRLDAEVVRATVDRCSTHGSVVLVEASDLRRALSFRSRATPELAEVARQQALASTDRMLAALLEQVDPARDAVVVVAPTTQPDQGLGVLAIRAAEHPRGLLVSGNTSREGYVLLTDVAPSIARLAGAEMDEASIEGRAVEARASDRSSTDLREQLVDGEAAALFRDRMIEPVVLTVVVSVSLLALVAALALVRGWDRALPWTERAALVLLALPSMTYLAALLPFYDWGPAAYVGFLVGGAVVAATLCALLGRSWIGALALVYALLVVIITVSVVLLDSRLQVSTVFGDSPIVAGRFLGINNVTFAYYFLGAAMLACLAVHQRPGDAGRRAMVAILAAVLVVDVAPMWGADVGGALAGLPAMVVLGICLGRWRVRWRTLAYIALGTIVLIAALGALDLTRGSADRSHLGRLLERIGSEGASGLTTVVERKLSANIRSLTQSSWRFIFGPVAISAVLVAYGARDRLRAAARTMPPLRWAAPGLVALAVLGYGANDSGIAVPAAMVAAFVPGLVVVLSRTPSVEEA